MRGVGHGTRLSGAPVAASTTIRGQSPEDRLLSFKSREAEKAGKMRVDRLNDKIVIRVTILGRFPPGAEGECGENPIEIAAIGCAYPLLYARTQAALTI